MVALGSNKTNASESQIKRVPVATSLEAGISCGPKANTLACPPPEVPCGTNLVGRDQVVEANPLLLLGLLLVAGGETADAITDAGITYPD
ncbi:Uncharacterized protein TCM_010146 [Theobroma cacao]|uniref:Uncharacterized protein n=1 Tax=Theobroma cacao TaxID=3641 RepID=A0A061E5M8_THECC|nr:Uncharacterized protein TCM_010146 [Theobroma cacao]